MLTLSLNTQDKKALCIGGGRAAEIKIPKLLKHGIQVTLLSAHISPSLQQLVEQGQVQWLARDWQKDDSLQAFGLSPQDLLLLTTGDTRLNSSIQELSQESPCLVYRADIPSLGDFQFQAQLELEESTISIKSKQSNHRQSLYLKNYLEDLLTPIEFPEGKVYLVGFGPGDPELMTLKARKLLLSADIVFYDDLIGSEILHYITGDKVYVGKRKGQHYKTQDTINDLLLKAAQAGKRVVRLKGGDPFIFGRGGEELLHLHSHGIAVEVIPGISSSLAASAGALIPLTHRGVSRRLTFMSAHHVDTELETIPSEGTLVLYMGASKLDFLSQKLIQLGLAPQTGVALVYNASLPDQALEIRALQDIGQSQLKSPMAIIIGDVVNHFQQQLSL